ncbi:DJ-1/PfpI family protein [Bradyrhizobium tropiciagri]|uniref:GlxA family transcriptional regulator n=1 Tax=Bradyrhizobium tropiciagri TaxID=312253 RepID=UPI001BA6DA1D|nr:DJ-1/PfpI family protein [Bradyrhizobium tropiciagri]
MRKGNRKAGKRNVVILAFQGVTLFDITGPADVFDVASRYLAEAGSEYQVQVASIEGGLVRSSCGLALDSRRVESIDPAAIDMLFVCGGGPPESPPVPVELVAWLKANQTSVGRICSVCTGAFIVAAAGIADGRCITTHWEAVDSLASRYKKARVDRNAIFVRDGPLWSSAGFTAGIDLSIALIEEDYGREVAMQVARTFVMFLKRPGDQPQLSTTLVSQFVTDAAFADLHAWMSNSLDQDLSVPVLAERANMTTRTFSRRYRAVVGRTPAKTVELLRLEAACRMLKESSLSLKFIAKTTGFGDEQTLRRTFRRHFGVVPQLFGRTAGGAIRGSVKTKRIPLHERTSW